MTRLLAVVTIALVSVLPTRVRAGIADSPLPVLQAGATTQFLYSVPGVESNSALETYFSCTSIDTAPMQVGVELFDAPGGSPVNDAAASSHRGAGRDREIWNARCR